MQATDIHRVPRPKGFSALNGPIEKYKAGAKSMIQTGKAFGIVMTNTTASFSRLAIPPHVWKAAMVEGLEHELDEKKLMLGGLYHLSQGSTEIDMFAAYLTSRVIEDPKAHPILIKEFNSLLSNRARLAEAYTKLGQAMKEQGKDDETGIAMTPYEILEVINGPKVEDSDPFRDRSLNPHGIDLAAMAEDLKDTPECEPIPMDTRRKQINEKDKPKALPTTPEIVVAPK